MPSLWIVPLAFLKNISPTASDPSVSAKPPAFTEPAKFKLPEFNTGILFPVGVCEGVYPPTVFEFTA